MRLIAFPQWDKLTSLLRGKARQMLRGAFCLEISASRDDR